MVKTLLFLLSLAMLFIRESSLNWEGTGNMSVENMTVIKNYIQANFSLTRTYTQIIYSDPKLLTDFSQAFSRELNRQWDEAWNVFVPYYYDDQGNYDAVVYGYAFRDHWHWYNGIQFSDGYYASIVLWKDYNCKKWWRFTGNYDSSRSYDTSPGSFYQSALIPIFTNVFLMSYNGIWQGAYNLGHALETDSKTKDYAFTVIASQDTNAKFNGYFCAKDYALSVDIYNDPLINFGRALIMQTR